MGGCCSWGCSSLLNENVISITDVVLRFTGLPSGLVCAWHFISAFAIVGYWLWVVGLALCVLCRRMFPGSCDALAVGVVFWGYVVLCCVLGARC